MNTALLNVQLDNLKDPKADKPVTVYRSWRPDQVNFLKWTGAQVGDSVKLPEEPFIASWTLSPNIFNSVAHGGIRLKAQVPANSVLLTDRLNNTGHVIDQIAPEIQVLGPFRGFVQKNGAAALLRFRAARIDLTAIDPGDAGAWFMPWYEASSRDLSDWWNPEARPVTLAQVVDRGTRSGGFAPAKVEAYIDQPDLLARVGPALAVRDSVSGVQIIVDGCHRTIARMRMHEPAGGRGMAERGRSPAVPLRLHQPCIARCRVRPP